MKNVEVIVRNMTCNGCGACFAACPHGRIAPEQGLLGFPVPAVKDCQDCGACLAVCPFWDMLGLTLNLLTLDEEDR